MFGCLGRMGCLVLVALAGVGGWFTRDVWYPRVRHLVVAEPPASSVTWTPVSGEVAGPASSRIDRLSDRSGPVYVSLTPSEFVAQVMLPAMKMLGASAGNPEAAIHGDTLFVRANVALAELGDLTSLGPLAQVLKGRQSVVIGGRLDFVRKGVASFRVTRFTVSDLKLPAAAVAKILARAGMKLGADRIDASAVALPLPATVADVRITQGHVVLYKAVP